MTDVFLYRIDLIGPRISKIGVSVHPTARIASLRAQSAFDMGFARVLRFDHHRAATSWEAHIISQAKRHKPRGEWVVADDHLDSLIAAVQPYDDCTGLFRDDPRTGRPIPDIDCEVSIASVRKACLMSQVGVRAVNVAFDGSPADYNRAVIHARLADGYGVEDIAAMDGIDIKAVRAEVRKLRKAGRLDAVLQGHVTPTRRLPAAPVLAHADPRP
jgi:DNA-directed RNA polymerase specialized sigma24 family protein